MIYILFSVLLIGILVMIIFYVKTPEAKNYKLSHKLTCSNGSFEESLDDIKLVNQIDIKYNKEENNDL